MRDRHYRNSRLALGRVEKALRIERFTLHPGLKSGRRQQVVQAHRQRKAIFCGEKGVERHDADFRYRWILDLADQARNIEASAFAPGVIQQPRNQNVFATRDGIGIDTE